MGVIVQNFFNDSEHPKLGLPEFMDIPVESDPDKDIVSP